jgi:ribosomal protein S18 acetylase RimI-like enzyme
VNEITLRAATADDADALAELGERAFVAKFGHLNTPGDLAHFLASAHTPGVVAAEIADPRMRIRLAERDGALVGFCKLVMRCGWPEYLRGTNAIELKQLYLDPDLVGGGLGRPLMNWALAEAKAAGADEMQLSVWSGNDGAQRFYARYGFEKVADIEFWVGNHCDDEFLFAAML